MIRYLDTSAVAKVILDEVHTQPLRAALRRWQRDDLVSSQLMATELYRLVDRLGVPTALAEAVVAGLEVIDVERDDFLVAARLGPANARTLDVLHVAVAHRVGADALVTYDHRQAEVAEAAGLAVIAPT